MRPGRAGAVAVWFRDGRTASCLVAIGRASCGVVGGAAVSVVVLAVVAARCRRAGRAEEEGMVP